MPATHRTGIRLMGANPCVTLYDGERATAWASVWRVDWSEHGGTGHAVVVGDAERVRVIAPDAGLGQWLADEFNRHITSVSGGLPWREPDIAVAPVAFELDLAKGLRAEAGDVAVEITEPMDRALTRNDAYDLGGTPNVLSTVWMPCRYGSITVGGMRLPGAPRVDEDEPMSSAFIAEAEVWCRAES